MSVLTIRTDAPVELALSYLQTQAGTSRSEVVRQAVLAAEQTQRRAALRAEAEALRDDPVDVAAARQLAQEMADLYAW